MAPLKPSMLGLEAFVSLYFHDYFVMAPLKLFSSMAGPKTVSNFHDYFVMAPLKHTIEGEWTLVITDTSMTILSWPH